MKVLPPGWNASPWLGYPQDYTQQYACHLNPSVERSTVKVFFTQEHNTVAAVRARTWTRNSEKRTKKEKVTQKN